ncbi:Glycosyltransferase [Synechococcus sp. RCC307]|nr:Glycosyltransferase [Synechococcus sp. RCC307]
MNQPLRLAVLITHPIQYFRPVFAELAQQPGLELRVFFGCDHGRRSSLDPDFGVSFAWDVPADEGFPHAFISHAPLDQLSRLRSALPLACRAARAISAWQPDQVLIFAYTPVFIGLSTLLLKIRGQSLLLRADGTDRAFPRSWLKSSIKDLVLRIWYRQFRHLFPIGVDSDRHFARLGVAASRRHPVSYAVDVDFFAQQQQHWSPQRLSLRHELGIAPTDLVLLWSAKMTPVKAPFLLVEALAALPEPVRQRFWVVAMGDGPLRQAFEAQLQTLLPGHTHFLGFCNQSEIGRGYAMADALVFPSVQGETWGLVVNEALQFGLAVMASDHPGCAADLLASERPVPTGSAVFPSGDPIAFANALLAFAKAHPEGFSPQPSTDLPHPRDLASTIQHWASHSASTT